MTTTQIRSPILTLTVSGRMISSAKSYIYIYIYNASGGNFYCFEAIILSGTEIPSAHQLVGAYGSLHELVQIKKQKQRLYDLLTNLEQPPRRALFRKSSYKLTFLQGMYIYMCVYSESSVIASPPAPQGKCSSCLCLVALASFYPF